MLHLLFVLAVTVPSPAAVDDTTRQVLQRGRYQTELPEAAPQVIDINEPGYADTRGDGGADGSSSRERRERRARQRDNEQGDSPEAGAGSSSGSGCNARDQGGTNSRDRARRQPRQRQQRVAGGGAGGALSALLRVVLIAVAVLVVGWIIFAVFRRRNAGEDVELDERPVTKKADAEAESERKTLRDLSPEDLAGSGRFNEAIRALLFRVFDELGSSREQAIPPAWTSREVASDVAVEAELRAPLRRIVAAVEGCEFGGRVAELSLYERCRDDAAMLLNRGGSA